MQPQIGSWYVCRYGKHIFRGKCVKISTEFCSYPIFILIDKIFQFGSSAIYLNIGLTKCIQKQFNYFVFTKSEIVEEIPEPYEV